MTPESLDFETLAARVLHSSRAAHLPTYAGLRILLETLKNDKAGFVAFLDRRSRDRTSWRYYGYQIVKEVLRGKSPSFRNCVYGSPLTALAEAYVLSLMAREPAFAVPACAFSYEWPAGRTVGRNFAPFIDGYDRRNQLIANLLTAHRGSVAIVMDVKSFYPSVDKRRLSTEIELRLQQVADPPTRSAIHKFTASMIGMVSPKTVGLPIGPDLSHTLGHVALGPVDAALQSQFANRYLRYVDDVVLVVPRNEVKRSLEAVRAAFGVEGLVLNEDKQDEVDAKTWHEKSVIFKKPGGQSVFDTLIDEITLFVLRHPDQAAELHAKFRDAGYALPVGRFQTLTKSRRFLGYFRRRIFNTGSLLAWLRGLSTTQQSLLVQAAAVRRELTLEAERLAEELPATSPQRRRWYAQTRRLILGRLLYLCPLTQYRKLLSLTPDLDEFAEHRMVIQSLMSQDFSHALGYPGRVVATICQLWSEHYPGKTPHVAWPAAPTRMHAGSAADFALRLGVTPPEEFFQALRGPTPGSENLVRMCAASTVNSQSIINQSYLDEMVLLYRSMTHDNIVRFVGSRFDESEDVCLDGLMLGGGSNNFYAGTY